MKSASEWLEEFKRRVDEVPEVTDALVRTFVEDVQADTAASVRVEATAEAYEKIGKTMAPRGLVES